MLLHPGSSIYVVYRPDLASNSGIAVTDVNGMLIAYPTLQDAIISIRDTYDLNNIDVVRFENEH